MVSDVQHILGWVLVFGIGIPALLAGTYFYVYDAGFRFAMNITAAILFVVTGFFYGLHLVGVIE